MSQYLVGESEINEFVAGERCEANLLTWLIIASTFWLNESPIIYQRYNFREYNPQFICMLCNYENR